MRNCEIYFSTVTEEIIMYDKEGGDYRLL